MSTNSEMGGGVEPPGAGKSQRLGSEIGLEYYKLLIGRAEAAWEKLHTITRWNYAAFIAATAVAAAKTGEGIGLFEIRIWVVGIFVVVASIAASALVQMQMRYSIWLFGYAWSAEKALVGNRTSEGMIRNAKLHRQRSDIEKGNTMSLRPSDLKDVLTNIHVVINLLPAFCAVAAMILLHVR